MGAIVVLQGADDLRVDPGRTTTAELSVANTASIVEQFTIMLLGDAVEWTESDPPVVSLFPGAQQTVTLRFSPPRNYTTPSGEVPFGVKVIPSNEPEESVTEEGVITVGSFNDVGAELVPRVATARLTGHQKLAVDSRGNIPLPVVVTAIDSADALKFKIRPDKLTTAPGEARYIRVKVKPRQLFWKGHNQHKPYKVQVNPADESPLVLDGALTQKPVFPKWFWPALLIAGALLLLFFFVLKPIVHNDAVNANKAALAAQQAQTKALANQVAVAQQSANQANKRAAAAAALAVGKKPPATTTTTSTTVKKAVVNVVKPAPTTTKAPTTTTATTVAPTTPTTQPQPTVGPNDGQLLLNVTPPNNGSNAFPAVPAKSTLQITNLIIQNVSGGSGTALLQRVPATPGKPAVTLLVEDLNTLTDVQYQFGNNGPMLLTAGERLMLTVHCNSTGEVPTPCVVNIYYTGPLTTAP
jgi:hypothetical protein